MKSRNKILFMMMTISTALWLVCLHFADSQTLPHVVEVIGWGVTGLGWTSMLLLWLFAGDDDDPRIRSGTS